MSQPSDSLPSTSAPRRAGSFLQQRQGPLTRELLLAPASFGLGQMPAHRLPDATARCVCGYCSVGCSLQIHLRAGQPIGLTPDPDYPVNTGMACPKGWEALTVLGASDRATTPLFRAAGGGFKPLDWDSALRLFCERFRHIQARHGPESVAFLSTGQIATEEMAFLGALAKFGMGMIHGDGNTRQCMATAVVAYKQSFGFDAPPYTYQDLEESDVIVLVGSNLCIAHPILWEHVLRNPHAPRIIVIDPRCTETAMAATLHLPIRPKSDLVLCYGLARLLIENGWIDRAFIDAHTNGFDAFAGHVRDFTPEQVSEHCGIDASTLQRLAEIIHAGRRVSFWWTMGVNQSYEGVRVAQALINLALITGHIGRPGTGANSITGQCNAMGSRLFSNTTHLLGGRDFLNEAHRAEVAGILGIDAARIPPRNSGAYHEIIEGIAAGQIRGLWIIATNTAHSWINQHTLRELLGRLDFLVVQDMYATTETARLAHLILPAAGWAEKEGTFINSERRLGRIRKVARAPGSALSDFAIFKLISEYWGCGPMFEAWSSPEAVFQILRQLSRGRPCDISGIRDYAMIEDCGGVQWPYSEQMAAAEYPPATHRRLFADGRFFHPDGRAVLHFDSPRPMPEPPDEHYPFILLTGRGSAVQWHTQTRTAKSAILRKLYPARFYVEINPADARRLNITAQDRVLVESRRGSVEAAAFLTPCVQPGQLFLPMHYATTNQLTDPVFDPHSKQPSYKACAVNLRKPQTWETGQ